MSEPCNHLYAIVNTVCTCLSTNIHIVASFFVRNVFIIGDDKYTRNFINSFLLVSVPFVRSHIITHNIYETLIEHGEV